MPEPTESETFTENGTYDVGRIGTAIIDVDIDLQDKTVTPTEQTQTIEADAGYDGLDAVTVNPIPPEYVVPTGSVEITQNGPVNVAGKATANVNVPQGVFPAGTKLITQNVTGEDVTNFAAVDVAVPEYDDGGWGREVGAPNLDLLVQPGAECAQGSGNHVLFFSYYISEVFNDAIQGRINNKLNLQTVKDVTINSDGSYTVNQDITFDGSGYFTPVNTVGWHVLRFGYASSNYALTFYTTDGLLPFTDMMYEAVICGSSSMPSPNIQKVSFVDYTGSMSNVFAGKNKLVKFDFLTSNRVNANGAKFSGCSSLREIDLTPFDLSNLTSTGRFFENCTNLRKIKMPTCNTSNSTDLSYMFQNCVSLAEIDMSSFNLGKITRIASAGLNSLQKVIFPDGKTHQYPEEGTPIDTWIADPEPVQVGADGYIFGSCNALKYIENFPIFHTSFTANYPALTVDSVMTILNALPEVETSQTVTIGATNIAKLTADQIAIAQDKGWTVT